jgi:sucrose phosphorylase
VRNQVQLIAYADRFGGSLRGLRRLLDGPLAGAFGGVHVLPFYPPFDGADAGFDPDDHLAVDPRLGTWADVADLGRGHDVVADLIVNHMSDRSAPFRDVVERGDASPFAGMFLTYEHVFPTGASEADLLRIVRPRPNLPFTRVDLGGRPRLLWTTFTPHQIDLDVHHPDARAYLSRVLRRLADCGVTMVRLDAVGYTVKTAGTSCFLTPQTFTFIDDLTAEAHGLGLRVLAEVHAPQGQGEQAATHVDRVYDFALAPLVLHTVFTGDADPLRRWLATRPTNAVTVLDTHDGLGMIDAAGLLTPAQIEAVVERIGSSSNSTSVVSRVPSGVYQVSCTAYDALGRDDRPTCWRDFCSCSPREFRRCTTSDSWPAATLPTPATPGRSTATDSPRRRSTGRYSSPWSRPCWNSSGYATPTPPSTASSHCRTQPTGSSSSRGAPATPARSCASFFLLPHGR